MSRSFLLVLALILSGCTPAVRLSDHQRPAVGELNVFAAASLTEAFRDIADWYGREREPLLTLRFNFAGSSTLASQLEHGATADAFASADEPNMQRAVAAGLVDGAPRVFATNRLQIVVAAGNPMRVQSLADLARPELIVVLAAPAVPVGGYAREALRSAGVTLAPASLEADVKAVLTKVALGEADAGIVYATDVRSGGAAVAAIDIPDAHNVVARYFIAQLRGSDRQASFVEPVFSTMGQRLLARHGFGPPP